METTNNSHSANTPNSRAKDAGASAAALPSSSGTSVRVAVIQLTCHPSLVVGAVDYLTEPLFPADIRILHTLQDHQVDVQDLQTDCRRTYLAWHRERIKAALKYCADLDDDTRPAIIVFPEGSIPLALLDLFTGNPEDDADEWGGVLERFRETGTVVFAGSHSFTDSEQAIQTYTRANTPNTPGSGPRAWGLGIPRSEIDEIRHQMRADNTPSPSVTPVIEFGVKPGGGDAIRLVLKTRLSPFELTGIGRPQTGRSQDRPIELKRKGMNVLLMVCSEALQSLGQISEGVLPQLVIVPSYDHEPTQFDRVKSQYAENLIPVIYCNDGAFGGSSVWLEADRRGENWWFRQPREGRLPKGDGILLMEVTPGKAVVTGTARTTLNHAILRVTAIVPDNPELPEGQAAEVMSRLKSTIDILPKVDVDKFSGKVKSCVDPKTYVEIWNLIAAVPESKRSELSEQIDQFINEEGKNTSSLKEALAALSAGFHGESLILSLLNVLQRDDSIPARSPRRLTEVVRQQLLRLTALVRVDRAPAHEWEVFADAVRFRLRAPKDGKPAPPTRNFGGLQRLMSERCLTRFGFLLQKYQRSDELTQCKAILRARATIVEFLGHSPAMRPADRVTQLIQQLREEAMTEAKGRLTHAVAALVERFKATSGMLFIRYPAEGEKPNIQHPGCAPKGSRVAAHIMFNVPVPVIERQADATSQGIVGRVAFTGQAYLNNHVADLQGSRQDDLFLECIPSTQAEMAVPIFAPAENGESELVAVLNLESRIPGAFVPLQLGELECAGASLAPDIRIYQAGSDSKRLVLWHPAVHGWSLRKVLDRFCQAVTHSLDTGFGSPLSCTIWYHDAMKGCLYVRGTSRFDYEYISENYLSLESFMGSVADKSCGEVVRDRVEDVKDFRRPRKAERMELNRVIATPIGAPGHMLTRNMGVLALYSFKHEHGPGEGAIDEVFSDGIVTTLAASAGRIVKEIHQLRRSTATALMKARLIESAVSGFDEFEQIKATVCDCLDAESASVFLKCNVADGPPELKCVATTGLSEVARKGYAVRKVDEVGRRPAPSWLKREEADWPVYKGFTEYLASKTGLCLRKLDIPDITEPCYAIRFRSVATKDPSQTAQGFYIAPRNSTRERGAMTRWSHRRFLGASVASSTDTESDVLGVVRIVRSEHSAPFVEEDEELLECLLASARAPFLNRIWYQERLEKEAIGKRGAAQSFKEYLESQNHTSDFTPQVPEPSARSAPSQPNADPSGRTEEVDILKDDIHEAARRMLFVYRGANWNRRWLESWLQDLRLFLRPDVEAPDPEKESPIFANIRVVTESGADWNLSFLAHYSSLKKQFPWDDAGRPRSQLNIGWRALDRAESKDLVHARPALIWFDRNGTSLYNCAIPHGEARVTHGLTIPMVWVIQRHFVQGVVSVDFAMEIENAPTIMDAVFAATNGLGVMGIYRPNVGRTMEKSTSMQDWLERYLPLYLSTRGAPGLKWAAIFSEGPYFKADQSIAVLSQKQFDTDALAARPATKQRLFEANPLGKTIGKEDGCEANRFEPKWQWVRHADRLGVTWDRKSRLQIPLHVGAFPMFSLVCDVTPTGLDANELATLALDIAEEWSRALYEDLWFWDEFTASFPEDASAPGRNIDVGLHFWEPRIELRKQPRSPRESKPRKIKAVKGAKAGSKGRQPR